MLKITKRDRRRWLAALKMLDDWDGAHDARGENAIPRWLCLTNKIRAEKRGRDGWMCMDDLQRMRDESQIRQAGVTLATGQKTNARIMSIAPTTLHYKSVGKAMSVVRRR